LAASRQETPEDGPVADRATMVALHGSCGGIIRYSAGAVHCVAAVGVRRASSPRRCPATSPMDGRNGT
jgi:hypothetical protein